MQCCVVSNVSDSVVCCVVYHMPVCMYLCIVSPHSVVLFIKVKFFAILSILCVVSVAR